MLQIDEHISYGNDKGMQTELVCDQHDWTKSCSRDVYDQDCDPYRNSDHVQKNLATCHTDTPWSTTKEISRAIKIRDNAENNCKKRKEEARWCVE